MSQPWFEPSDADDAGGGTPPPRTPRRPATSGRRPTGPLVPTIVILIVLATLVSYLSRVWTDLLWYDSVGFRSVFTTRLGTQILLFGVGLLVTAGLVWSSLYLAHRSRPLRIPMTPAQHALEQYRRAIEPLRKIGMIAIPVLLGLLGASTLSSQWQTYLLWANGGDFGTKDPQFGLDLGFFVFDVPFIQLLIGFLTMALALALVSAVVVHYIYGGLQLPGRGPTTRAAYVHIGVLGALLFLVRGAAYWFGRYAMASSESSLLTGIKYTDDHAVLPTKAILAVAAVICAVLFVAAIWTRTWRLPIVAVALLTVLTVVVGGIYPSLVQTLKVKPSEKSLEAPYLQHSIDATRAAYGLDGVAVADYPAVTKAEPERLREDAMNIPGIRIMDPNVIGTTFNQTQAKQKYYTFPDALDVDRYTIDGTSRDSVVAARELDIEGIEATQRNWLNDHTVYTHGYGLVVASGTQRGPDGDPVYYVQDFSTKGPDGTEYEPRIYFGESSSDYAIVGGSGQDAREFDSPGATNYVYTGDGGVSVGSFLRKTAYAILYREPKFLLSDVVNDKSRILDHRTPLQRVQRVAPWLTVDSNAYPSIVAGRVTWILDGYTTTSRYPYSQLVDMDSATSDAVTDTVPGAPRTLGSGQINYIRNSVKATVDAYTGEVNLYAWDESDPILKAWERAFPGTIKPLADISAPLMSHLRYPQDLLKIQRVQYAKFHVDDPGTLYTASDLWRVPKDPAHETKDQPVYYQSLAMPDQAKANFSTTTLFLPNGSELLRGFMAVDSDAGSTAGKRNPGYGKMRLLVLPRTTSINGPGQVENQIENSTVPSQAPKENLNLSQYITQNRQGGKKLTLGNLLTLPVGGGLLYVQPIYVQQATTAQGSFPQNKAIVAMFGQKVGWGETLGQALDGVFGGDAGTGTGDGGGGGDGGGTQPPPTGTGAAALTAAVAKAQAAYDDGQTALKAQDFAAYGAAQKRLAAALAEIERLLPKAATTTPTTTPTTKATATPSG